MTQTAKHLPRTTIFFLFAIVLLALTACTNLNPLFLALEQTAGPVSRGIWKDLGKANNNNWQIILNRNDEALDWRLRAIDSANTSLDLQTFLWEPDVVGSAVLSHVVEAANRGVKVKLLVDDSFLAGDDRTLLALQRHPLIEYKVYNPYKRRTNNAISREFLNLGEFNRLDHRMHNKAMIIDDQVAIVGGRNQADDYFGLHSKANFRDMELLVGGPIVQEIARTFDDYWNDPWAFPIDQISHIKFEVINLEGLRKTAQLAQNFHVEQSEAERQLSWETAIAGAHRGQVALYADRPPTANPTSIESRPVQVAEQLMHLINGAEKDVLIASAYLIPTPVLEDAIARAVARGVSVRILTNSLSSNNHVTAHAAYRNHIRQLLTSGARLHEVRSDAVDRARYILQPVAKKSLALHAKVMAIDDTKVFIGSSNLDPRSLRINTEMGLLVTSASVNRELREKLRPDYTGANAWEVKLNPKGQITWQSDNLLRRKQPETSKGRRLEDWFFAHLPIEGKL